MTAVSLCDPVRTLNDINETSNLTIALTARPSCYLSFLSFRGLILTSSGPENGVPQLQHNQYVSISKSYSHRKRGHCGIA
ncbi:hypothetical protein DPMN_019114 [Dreissena polymorpha]|uniref:Uncharacterized protein n=1 Tax=Dreissena polymorpha TaxID=45954 RepID=A0A9D4NJR9_DREPO|nr:hypothetical protein DPMN_019114 [Dreissena polymorpha]